MNGSRSTSAELAQDDGVHLLLLGVLMPAVVGLLLLAELVGQPLLPRPRHAPAPTALAARERERVVVGVNSYQTDEAPAPVSRPDPAHREQVQAEGGCSLLEKQAGWRPDV